MSRRHLCPNCGANLTVVGVEKLSTKTAGNVVVWEVERCGGCSYVLGGRNLTPSILASLPAVGSV